MSYTLALDSVTEYAVRRREEMPDTTEGADSVKSIIEFIDLVKVSPRFEELQHASQHEELMAMCFSSETTSNFIRGGVTNLFLKLGSVAYDTLVSSLADALAVASTSTIKNRLLPTLDRTNTHELLKSNPWLVFCLLLRYADLIYYSAMRDNAIKGE